MPFYEYECGACGNHHEALQKVSDAPLKKCPTCGKARLRKLVSAPVFRLKGSGWYETDFKSDKEGKRNLAVEKDEAPKTESADKPSDKPADKPTEKPSDTAKGDSPKTEKKDGAAPAKAAAKSTAPARRRAPSRKTIGRKVRR